MIELINVTKEYKQQEFETIKALNNISLTLPNRGIVFILGKSGSGKTTLLNVIGGLDKIDSGEIIVEGKSTKDFNIYDWDAYRNTFVGFVFQDYNLLEEYTIRKNISLALEFQGLKVRDDEINNILKQVDLEGYCDRYPSELSTGQKQRVTIARALIKNSRLILADEPTGSLDTKTSHLILKLLKEISREKLVVVVTHDRGLAEMYGDRIIEIKDGQVIYEQMFNSCDETTKNIASDISLKSSQFSIKNAFSLAYNSIKLKPIKLSYIIILSTFMFVLFGLISSASNYDHNRIILESMYGRGMKILTFNSESSPIELKKLSERLPNYSFYPVFNYFYKGYYYNFVEYDDSEVYDAMIYGVFEINEKILNDYSLKLLAGRLPQKNNLDNEIVISEYMYKHFERYGYYNEKVYVIEKKEDMLEKDIYIGDECYHIVGVIDTNFDFKRYSPLLEKGKDDFQRQQLSRELETVINYGIHNVLFMRDGYFKDNLESDTLLLRNSTLQYTYQNNKFELNEHIKILRNGNLSNVTLWLDGKTRENLVSNEIILPKKFIEILDQNILNKPLLMTLTYLDKSYDVKVVGLSDGDQLYVSEEQFYHIYKPYKMIVSKLKNDYNEDLKLIETSNELKIPIKNEITVPFEYLQSFLKTTSIVAFYIALILIGFNVILLINFILTIIMMKKRDIGILRAIGASQRDVFNIFIMESLIISLFSAFIGTFILFIIIRLMNHYVMNQFSILFTLLHINGYQLIILFGINIIVTILSTFFPIYKFAKKKPIEVIRYT